MPVDRGDRQMRRFDFFEGAISLALVGMLAAPHGAWSYSLYDQNNSCADSSTTSENIFQHPVSESRVADDFVVTSGEKWSVQQISVNGGYFGGSQEAASFNVNFYENSPGEPGASSCSYTSAAYVQNENIFTISLPVACELLGGPSGRTYWISVQANLSNDPNTDWTWADRSVQSGNPAYVEYPGGATSNPQCESWGTKANCIDASLSAAPDQCFALLGSSETTPVLPTGTLYDQSVGDYNGEFASFVSSDFSEAVVADDFFVPPNLVWDIDSVSAGGKFSGTNQAASFNIFFYADSSGVPGALIATCTYSNIAYSQRPGDPVSSMFSFQLPTACSLAGGVAGSTYWMSVQANFSDSNNLWYWYQRSAESGNPGAVQYPASIYSQCRTWSSIEPCIDSQHPDVTFALMGSSPIIFRNGFEQ
jgi:hypothetical protein